MPSFSTSNCSLGSYSRDVKRAACSSRQKSLRGFAKCARAASETRPGLIPQKTTRRPGARTSGTALGGFGLWDEPFVEPLLEATPEIFAGHARTVAGAARLELDRLDGRIVVAVQTDVALGFRQRAESPHETQRRTRSGRHNPDVATPKPREFRFAVDLGDELRTEDGTPLGADAAWSPEHLLLAALVRCSLASLDYHARRADNGIESSRGNARALFTRRESDGRYAATEIDVELGVKLRAQPGEDELRDLLEKAERDCFISASLTAKPRYDWSLL
jgi:organic hydroperoxide reductase OsmC/OhrA